MPSTAPRFSVHSVLLPAAAAIVALVPFPPQHVEHLYSRSLYPLLQPPITRTSNLLPFAVLDLIVAGGVAWVIWCLVRRFGERRGVMRTALLLARDLAVSAASVYLIFALFWGMNYQRRPGGERFGVDRSRVTEEHLRRFGDVAVARLNSLYDPRRDETRLALDSLAADLQPPFSRALARIGQPWQPAPGRPKSSWLAHLFPLAAVDGMMNPLALEVIVSPGVLPFERPFLLAHEWAHLAGHARESEASFLGWLTCMEGDRVVQYSGWMAVVLHVARSLADGRALLARLDDGPQRDLAAIRTRLARARPAVSLVTWRVYDRYLRAHRVEAGVANYDEVTILLLGSPLAARHVPR